MFSRKKKTSFFFEGQEINRLEECPDGLIMFEESQAWEKLKKFLKDNSLTVWVTVIGWDRFLNNTIMTGNIPAFINYLDSFIKRFPSKEYLLTNSGKLKVDEKSDM